PLVSGSKTIERINVPANLSATSQLAPPSALLNKPRFVPAKMRLELYGSTATDWISNAFPGKPDAADFHVDPASVLVNTEAGPPISPSQVPAYSFRGLCGSMAIVKGKKFAL